MVSGVGILVGVAYTLRVLQKAFFADPETAPVSAAGNGAQHHQLAAISTPERIGAALLILASLVIGLYPRLLLDLIGPSFSNSLFDALRKRGGF